MNGILILDASIAIKASIMQIVILDKVMNEKEYTEGFQDGKDGIDPDINQSGDYHKGYKAGLEQRKAIYPENYIRNEFGEEYD